MGWAVQFVGTEGAGLILVAHQLCAAFGTAGYELHGLCVGQPFREVHADNLGDDFAALFHKEVVALADVECGHHVGVVQGGPFYDRACERHGRQVGYGSYNAGSTDLIINT